MRDRLALAGLWVLLQLLKGLQAAFLPALLMATLVISVKCGGHK